MFKDLILFENENVLVAFTTRECQASLRREELTEKAAQNGHAVVRLSLVHGNRIVHVTAQDLLLSCGGLLDYEDADGAVTAELGTILTTGHADCLPLYAYDPIKKAIGLAHAGWKGTLVNIAGSLVGDMVKYFGSKPENIVAFIGPGIGPCCFEVGKEVAEAFVSSYEWATENISTKPDGKFYIDLKSINKKQLQLCGLPDITVSLLCTKCREDLFFSYRRAKEKGRMLAYIYLKGENK